MIQSITFGDFKMDAKGNLVRDENGYTIFVGKNTWDDWKILPKERPVFAPPEQKTTYIDIPGGNGTLDLSESLSGYPVYKNRTGSFTFRVMNDYVEWHERYSEIMEYLHGKRMKAILYDDPDWFYEGRFAIDSWTSQPTWSEITIKYDVHPYKWSVELSTDPWRWDTFNFEKDIIRETSFRNISVNHPEVSGWEHLYFDEAMFGSAPVSPVFDISDIAEDNRLEVRFNNFLAIQETRLFQTTGRYEIPEFVFYGKDSYKLDVRGVATFSIEFRRGRL